MRNKQHEPSVEQLRKVGIVGIPPVAVIKRLNENGVTIYDLDEPIVKADLEHAAPYLPRVYCAILRTAVVNALHLDLDAVYIDVGPGKCDSALYTADVLDEVLPIPVIRTINQDTEGFGTPICRSSMPLLEKMQAITKGVRTATPPVEKPIACEPIAGFWGVPPRDFSILTLFPDATHIYGWTRCMENKTPDNPELEAHVNWHVPTVFFSQSFCAKTALARYLAKKHRQGLYLDVDVHTTGSAKAKIQAFLELSKDLP